jgi:NTE family protein
MKRALVLGGGGLVGMGYHAGALVALEEAALDPRSSDLIVGTSAGAIVAAYLSSGWSPGDLYAYARAASPASAPSADAAGLQFPPLWRTPHDRLRRVAGGAFVMVAALGHWARVAGTRTPGPWLRAAFPSGLYSSRETRRRLRSDLPVEWPRRGLYLCAADLYSGQRVVFGAPGAPPARFSDAALASAAVAGIFEPVRIADRLYVDGGMRSATSLDLAVAAGCELIVCIAPLGWEPEDGVSPYRAPFRKSVLLRSIHTRLLNREVAQARAAGVEVKLLRPWLTELPAHGINSLRPRDRAIVAEAARRNALRLLQGQAI